MRDRDGFFLGRNLKPINLGNDYELFLQPQFLIQRAFNGKTNSYVSPGSSTYSQNVSQDALFSDLLGLEVGIVGDINEWDLDLNADISTFNSRNFIEGSRYWGDLTKQSELYFLGIEEHKKNLGYGARLLQKVITDSKALGAKEIFIEVNEFNKVAIKLYVKCGFKKYGVRKNYYKNALNSFDDAVLMKLQLQS